MNGTEPASNATESEPPSRIDPGAATGYARLLAFGGMAWLGLGSIVDIAVVFWGGVAILGLAFALNTVGKLAHYRALDVTRGDELKLASSWILLALTVLALLTNYAYVRYGGGGGEYFWSLAVAGIGFGLLHMAAQSRYLPASAVVEQDATDGEP